MQKDIFKQPIIILSAPRAGSTLLFEALAKSSELWTIGGESHEAIEGLPQLRPGYKNSISNELTHNDADQLTIQELKLRFKSRLINKNKQPYDKESNSEIRFLEKTPKNALRISFLNQVFPDAKFIYLIRDPKENISSMIDAWNSKRFITYPYLPNFHNKWSLLLLPNWPSLIHKKNHEIATEQWKQCNQEIIHHLSKMPQEKWQIVNYEDFLKDPNKQLTQLAKFINIDGLDLCSSEPLEFSEHTLTQPMKNKWHKNADVLSTQMPHLAPLVKDINDILTLQSASLIYTDIETSLLKTKNKRPHEITKRVL